MLNKIKFTVCIVDGQNIPCGHLLINCRAVHIDKQREFQFFYKKLDANGKAEFEFTAPGKEIEVEMEVRNNRYNHTFKNEDEVTFKLYSYDDLNIFLELITLENSIENSPALSN